MNKPKKSLGQNFIIDKNICKKIVKLIKIRNKEIIEIGPGKGKLTDEILIQKPKKLTIIEKDNFLYLKLIEKYKKIKNINIINCDALNFDYVNKNKKKIIIGNLPYNISIKLIINLLKINDQFSEFIFMIQKEVAEKMNYKNIKKNRLNTLLELSSEFKIKFNVSNNVFLPKPKVMSSVIMIIPKKKIKINISKFENFTKEIFKYKRKKLSNVLKNKINLLNKQFDKNLLEKRAEDLKINEIKELFNLFYNY